MVEPVTLTIALICISATGVIISAAIGGFSVGNTIHQKVKYSVGRHTHCFSHALCPQEYIKMLYWLDKNQTGQDTMSLTISEATGQQNQNQQQTVNEKKFILPQLNTVCECKFGKKRVKVLFFTDTNGAYTIKIGSNDRKVKSDFVNMIIINPLVQFVKLFDLVDPTNVAQTATDKTFIYIVEKLSGKDMANLMNLLDNVDIVNMVDKQNLVNFMKERKKNKQYFDQHFTDSVTNSLMSDMEKNRLFKFFDDFSVKFAQEI